MSTGRGTAAGTRTLERERVAIWPRVTATVGPDGRGTLSVNGTERPCAAASVDELRTGVIARTVTLARRLHRPVRLSVTDGDATWPLAVRPDGVVQLLDQDGTIAPAHDLAPHEGRCRACRHLQAVTTATCTQCGVDEPHRVETDPVRARDVVPDAVSALDTLADPPITPAATARALHLRFSTQPDIETTENVALGRNPEPVGGRRTIKVTSPERMLSRTHVLIDVDDRGRIIVTDQHSGNGTEAQTQPPMRLVPGTPYVVHDGTTLLLGDVAVLVKLV